MALNFCDKKQPINIDADVDDDYNVILLLLIIVMPLGKIINKTVTFIQEK